MKKIKVSLLLLLCILVLVSCRDSGSTNESVYADYQFQATMDDNDEILILAKSESALNEFIQEIVSNEMNSDFSDLDQVYIHESSDALAVESAEFQNCDPSDPYDVYSFVYIKVRNNSGQSGTLLNLNVDFIDENGDIIYSSYPQYGSIVEDGQACTMDVIFEGIPYGIRVASADITPMSNGYTSDERIEVFFETPFIAINPGH